MAKAALYTAATIFAVVALSHLTRFLTGSEIILAGWVVPVWLSLPAGLIAGALAVWMVAAARRG